MGLRDLVAAALQTLEDVEGLALARVFDFEVVPAAGGEDVFGAQVYVELDFGLGLIESGGVEWDRASAVLLV